MFGWLSVLDFERLLSHFTTTREYNRMSYRLVPQLFEHSHWKVWYRMLLDACKVCSFPGMHPIVVVKTARRPLSSSTQLTGRTGHLIYLVCCIWTFLFLAPNILNSIFFYLGVKYQHYSRCHKSEVPFVFLMSFHLHTHVSFVFHECASKQAVCTLQISGIRGFCSLTD